MTVEDLIKNLKQLIKDGVITKDTEVVYSSDDEGNTYNHIYFNPTPGAIDDNNEFRSRDEIPDNEINCVCIN